MSHMIVDDNVDGRQLVELRWHILEGAINLECCLGVASGQQDLQNKEVHFQSTDRFFIHFHK